MKRPHTQPDRSRWAVEAAIKHHRRTLKTFNRRLAKLSLALARAQRGPAHIHNGGKP